LKTLLQPDIQSEHIRLSSQFKISAPLEIINIHLLKKKMVVGCDTTTH